MSILELQRHLNAVLSRRPGQVVGIWGEAGVGKTHSLLSVIRDTPCQNLVLHSTVPESLLVRSLTRPDKLPLWAEQILDRVAQDQPVNPQSLIDALAAALGALAPFVLCLEDLHEASPERLELIRKLAAQITRIKGVALLVSSRSEPPQPFKTYHLEPLNRIASDELLEAQAGGALPLEGLQYVYQRAKGNPLFTLEFWRYLSRQGWFWSDGKSWHWRKPDQAFIPISIEALISQMIQNLTDSPPAKTVLQVRALFPQAINLTDFEYYCAAVSQVEARVLRSCKELLHQQGFLSDGGFAHPLFQEVTLREISSQDQEQYSRRALELFAADRPEIAAFFVEKANLSAPETTRLLERAAEVEQSRGNLERAGQFWVQATQFVEGTKRGELALAADKALEQTAPLDLRVRLLETAMRDLPSDPETMLSLALVYTTAGQIEKAEPLVRQLSASNEQHRDWIKRQLILLQRMGKISDALEVWQAHPEVHQAARTDLALARAVGQIFSHSGQQDRALEIIQQALEQPNPDTFNRICLLDTLNSIYERKHDLENAQRYFDQALDLATEFNDPDLLAMVLSNGSGTLRVLGRYREMVENLERAMGLYAQAGRTMAYYNTGVMLSWALIELAQYERAESLLHEALEYFMRLGKSFMGTVCMVRLRHLYLDWNPPHGPNLARKYAYLALERGRASSNKIDLINGLVAAALYEATAGSASKALEIAQEGLDILSGLQIPGLEVYMLLSYGMALTTLGQKERAEAALNRALDLQGAELTLEKQKLYLQLDRLNGDQNAARERLHWFEQRGLPNAANLVRRYFPELTQTPKIEEVPARSTLSLGVLGSVQVEQKGKPIPFRAKKRLEILCYLLEARIAGRSEATVLELADVFYPGVLETEARATLKQQIYLIRVALGKDSVESTANGYALGNISSDAEVFLTSGDTGLWRGAYLERFSDGWFGGVREALVQALFTRCQSLLDEEPAEVLRLGQILLEMEPFDPIFLTLTLQVAQRFGNTKMAQRLYAEARSRFAEVGESLAPLETLLTGANPLSPN